MGLQSINKECKFGQNRTINLRQSEKNYLSILNLELNPEHEPNSPENFAHCKPD